LWEYFTCGCPKRPEQTTGWNSQEEAERRARKNQAGIGGQKEVGTYNRMKKIERKRNEATYNRLEEIGKKRKQTETAKTERSWNRKRTVKKFAGRINKFRQIGNTSAIRQRQE